MTNPASQEPMEKEKVLERYFEHLKKCDKCQLELEGKFKESLRQIESGEFIQLNTENDIHSFFHPEPPAIDPLEKKEEKGKPRKTWERCKRNGCPVILADLESGKYSGVCFHCQYYDYEGKSDTSVPNEEKDAKNIIIL